MRREETGGKEGTSPEASSETEQRDTTDGWNSGPSRGQGSLGDPSVASLPGVPNGTGVPPSDTAIARLPEADGYDGLPRQSPTGVAGFETLAVQRQPDGSQQLSFDEAIRQPILDRIEKLADRLDSLDEDDVEKLLATLAEVHERREGGLDNDTVQKVVKGFEHADDVELDPGGSPREVVDTLESITDNGLTDWVDSFGAGERFYKGMAGETDIAGSLLDRGIDPENIEFPDMVYGLDTSGSKYMKSRTEIDVDSGETVDVTGELDDSATTLEDPTFESKHENLVDAPPFLINDLVSSIKQKVITQANALGETEFVITLPRATINELKRHSELEPLRDDIQRETDVNVTLKFTSYDGLEG